MAKTDRSILVANDQSFGQIADPNKLETSIIHAYDKIDANDDEFLAHQRQVDPTSADTSRNKHVSNNDLKVLQDQITENSEDISILQTGKADKTEIYTRTELFTKTELESTNPGNSGATKIKTSPISGLAGTNVQTMLESANEKINQATLGQIPDGSITEQKLAFNPATQSELDAHSTDNVQHITSAERTLWNSYSAKRLNDVRTLSMGGMV